MTLIARGGVYTVRDDIIVYPEERDRDPHPTRYVIVMSSQDTNSDPNWPAVLVVPCSTQSNRKTPTCVQIAKGEGNMPDRCWARIVAVQPLLKQDMLNLCGTLPSAVVQLMAARLASYLGMI